MHNVKDRLGHSYIETIINIYVHTTKTESNKTADVFGDFTETIFYNIYNSQSQCL